MKIRKGDKVKIISGKDVGKEGVIEAVFPSKDKVVVKGVNVAKRHVKPSQRYKEGGIVKITKPIHVSNVALICTECKTQTRIGFTLVKDKKYRICRKCKKVIDKGSGSKKR